jgi:pyruvate dehydrogenase E1 component beta subunit
VRVVENLNRALHDLLAADPTLHLLGEDLADPYGGAFNACAGLSTRFPDQVLRTPLSENAIVGVAGGLALAGDKAIVEIMFADFVALAFDQLLNFASKSVTMYGRRRPMPLVVRCPSGGGRGYGPTHSQSPQKHFVGIPGLSLFELSPFMDARRLFEQMFALGEPCLLFEEKVLYTRPMIADGPAAAAGGMVDELFRYDLVGERGDVARVYLDDPHDVDCVLITPGGMAHRALAAMRSLLLEDDISCLLVVPGRLYPFDPAPVLPAARRARVVVVAEDGTAGGTWGTEIAHHLHRELWGVLRRPVVGVHGADSVIPAARHLEDRVVVTDTTIRHTVLAALRPAVGPVLDSAAGPTAAAQPPGGVAG